MKRILVVDDEPTILSAVATRLRAEAFEVETAVDGPSAVQTALAMSPDLVVLDVMLPGFDGLEVCRRIQAQLPVPVLMLTARTDETDMLVGLGIGADDYLTKPFSMRELVARVRVLLRRVDRAVADQPLSVGDYRIDLAERRVHQGSGGDAVEIHLTRTEFDLLAVPGRPAPGRGGPRDPAGTRVGLGRRGGDPHRGQPRQGAAPQARIRADPDGARRWLRPGDTAMSACAKSRGAR